MFLGLAGLPGESGTKGDIGNRGSIGPTGPRGEIGIKGFKGEHGVEGMIGFEGLQGVKGENGDIGIKGEIGDQGLSGQPGSPGESLGYDLKMLQSLMSQFKNTNLENHDNESFEKEQLRLAYQTYKHFKAKFQKFLLNGAFSYRSCIDIFYAFPNHKSGTFTIDPNEGDISDAISVYCNLEKKATCIEDIDNMKNGQLKFLKLLSTFVYQTIKFNCPQSSKPPFDDILIERYL